MYYLSDATIFLCFGSLILVLLCARDYRQRVWQPEKKFIYYLAFVLFIITNVALYLLLSLIITGTDPTMLVGQTSRKTDVPIDVLFYYLVLSFLYYGAGTYKISLFNVNIELYGIMISLLESLLNKSKSMIDRLISAMSNVETPTIVKHINEIHSDSELLGWEMFQSDWALAQTRYTMMRETLGDLGRVRRNIIRGFPEEASKNEALHTLDKRIQELEQYAREILLTYLKKLFKNNIKSEKEINGLLAKLPEAGSAGHYDDVGVLHRCLAMGSYGGLWIGLLFGIFHPLPTGLDNIRPTTELLITFACIFPGTLLFFGLMAFARDHLHSLPRVVAMSIIAGGAAHMVIIGFSHLLGTGLDFSDCVVGAFYGIATGFSLWFVRECCRRNPTLLHFVIPRVLLRRIAIALMGAGTFTATNLLIRIWNAGTNDVAIFKDWHLLIIGAIGTIVCLSLTLGLALFQDLEAQLLILDEDKAGNVEAEDLSPQPLANGR